jgi:hypothetical protein
MIPKFDKKAIIELDTDMGELIVSNRRNEAEKGSPSPSPAKYNIEPNKAHPFDFNLVNMANYESVKNKK